jgi:hypothetical protein
MRSILLVETPMVQVVLDIDNAGTNQQGYAHILLVIRRIRRLKILNEPGRR